MNKTGQDMLYLVGCALNEQKPEIKNDVYDLEKLYKCAKAHSLIAIVAMALEMSGVELPKTWIDEKEKAVRKSILVRAEYNSIINYFENTGIWYMPLKGWYLQEYYPKNGMRQMADIDILFDSKYRNEVKVFFESCGYSTESFGCSIHDIYIKKPIYNYEMHVSLYSEDNNKLFYEYYKNVKQKLIATEDSEYEYRFSKEDFYIYITAHAYKHYIKSGTGVRTIADYYVYLKAEENNLNWIYINEELIKLEISEFEKEIRFLCKKIFEPDNLENITEEEQEKINYYLFAGTYGTFSNFVENRVNVLGEGRSITGAKFMYLFKRLFPERTILEAYCPAIKKYKILLPYAWIKRVVVGLVFRHKAIGTEIHYVNKANENIYHGGSICKK